MMSKAIAPGAVLNVKDLASRWRCSPSEVYKLKDDRHLPYFIVGTKGVRFYLEDVIAYERSTYRAARWG
jgi:hypothetical protein